MRLSSQLLGGVALLLLLVRPGNAAIASASSPASFAQPPPLLRAAFDAFLATQGRWAYAETHADIASKGQRFRESILRIDPSQPYGRQIVPLKLNGQAATEKDIKEWAAHNEKIARQRNENATTKNAGTDREEFRLRVGNQEVTPLLDHATVIAENDTTVTYAVPLRLAGRANAPLFDTFQLTARVNKPQQQFEHVTFRQQKPFRIAAATYSDGLIEIEFGPPDARFPALPLKRTFFQTMKPLFGQPHRRHEEMERTDLRHVTPYDERFGVKIGPLRMLEF